MAESIWAYAFVHFYGGIRRFLSFYLLALETISSTLGNLTIILSQTEDWSLATPPLLFLDFPSVLSIRPYDVPSAPSGAISCCL